MSECTCETMDQYPMAIKYSPGCPIHGDSARLAIAVEGLNRIAKRGCRRPLVPYEKPYDPRANDPCDCERCIAHDTLAKLGELK